MNRHIDIAHSPSRPRRTLRLIWYTLLILALLASLAGCANTDQQADETNDRLGVAVSIVPQQYFVERIGGDHVDVSVMVGPGEEPHTYEPKPEQLKALTQAQVYFTIGVDFEQVWMDRIAAANTSMRIVDTTAGIERLPSVAHEHDGDTGGAEEEELDPHVWTSPRLVAQQAQIIADTLIELDPDHAADYEANLAAFQADIAALDAELRETLADAQGSMFIVFHPAWGYFARDYGLIQLPIEVEGQEPSAQELAGLVQTAKENNIQVVFAQPEMSTADAETIAREIGGKVLLISPLAEDWLANMRSVAETFAEALAQ